MNLGCKKRIIPGHWTKILSWEITKLELFLLNLKNNLMQYYEMSCSAAVKSVIWMFFKVMQPSWIGLILHVQRGKNQTQNADWTKTAPVNNQIISFQQKTKSWRGSKTPHRASAEPKAETWCANMHNAPPLKEQTPGLIRTRLINETTNTWVITNVNRWEWAGHEQWNREQTDQNTEDKHKKTDRNQNLMAARWHSG